MATTMLPVIDLSLIGEKESKLRVSKQLVDALKTIGFLYIDNAQGFDEDIVKKWCLWFFNLPQDTKIKLYRKLWNPESTNVYRGVFPVQKGETSYKEGFEIGNENQTNRPDHPIFGEGNVWPDADGVEEFKDFMVTFYDSMMKTSLEICHLICLGLGLREDWFDATFVPNTLSTLRLIHYPVRTEVPPPVAYEDGVIVCCADHSDSGFLTLLTTFNYPGLQIKLESGEWMDVLYRHNSLVMNIGDMLSQMTDGYLRATKHRVLDPMVDRFSVPFFLEPAYDADVGPYILTLIASEHYNVTIVNEDHLDELLESCDQNRTPNEHVKNVLRKKRNAIFPGTHWCGAGNIASNFDHLGRYNETDACCRGHDHCDTSIAPFTSQYGLTNTAIWYSRRIVDPVYTWLKDYTFITFRNHCTCDDRFYACLKASTDKAAESVGNLFFNFLAIHCIEETGNEVSRCVDWGWFRLWCNEYIQEPEMNWREPKPF